MMVLSRYCPEILRHRPDSVVAIGDRAARCLCGGPRSRCFPPMLLGASPESCVTYLENRLLQTQRFFRFIEFMLSQPWRLRIGYSHWFTSLTQPKCRGSGHSVGTRTSQRSAPMLRLPKKIGPFSGLCKFQPGGSKVAPGAQSPTIPWHRLDGRFGRNGHACTWGPAL